MFVAATGLPSPASPPLLSLDDGVLRVTTHRLLWVDAAAAPAAGASCALPLAAVARCELRSTRVWSSAKARVHVRVAGGDGRPVRGTAVASSSSTTTREVKIVARQQAAVHTALAASLRSRAWERDADGGAAAFGAADAAAVAAVAALGFSPAAAAAALAAVGTGDAQAAAEWLLDHPEAAAKAPASDPEPTLAASSAGVGGILARRAAAAAASDAAVDAAFVDLRALMGAAADMVALARRAAAAAGGAPTGLEADLASLGIASPVTRDAAGPMYVNELSRQLADFLAPRLGEGNAGGLGIIPLADAYCLFNRARGVELATPADVAAAARAWEGWRAPVRLRDVGGGVLAVQAASLDDAAVRARLASLAADSTTSPNDDAFVLGLGRPLTPSAAAAALRVPVAVAAALLLDAERAGALCREDGPAGVRHWANFFVGAAV